jgi:hypothetical protein
MWKRVLADVSLDVDYSADGSSYKRGDLSKEQVKGMFLMAENAVRQWLPQVEDVIIQTLEGKDPYQYDEGRDSIAAW